MPKGPGDSQFSGGIVLAGNTSEPSLEVQPQVPTSASTSAGGAVHVNNSLNTGAGVVVYSEQAAPSGRLVAVRVNSATYNQTALYAESNGTGHALHANQTTATPNATGSALNVTSANSGASAVQVGGVETGKGTIKVTHTGPGDNSDANASALSIDLQGVNTAAQGIHIDSVARGTTGALLDIRNNGNQLLKVISDATFAIPSIVLGNGGPIITFGAGSPEGVVTAPVGSMYFNSTGTVANTTVYVKRTGTGNTGWFPVTA